MKMMRFPRIMPGKKDYVSIGRNIHKQKDLKELHSIFRSTYPARQIGFSKFCSLHPKWCVLPGSSGKLCLCVHSLPKNEINSCNTWCVSHTELYEFLVCDINSKECMIHRCPNCLENTEMLESKLYELIGNYNDETVTKFNQWISTDRANLILCSKNVPQFIYLVVQQLEKLTAHSFIAKCQSNYLRECKEI